jgi:hypothetical protein
MKNSTHISIVLDRSGSMVSVAEDTIGGFNQIVGAQREIPDVTLSLVQFDNEYEVVFNAVPIKKVPTLTARTYVPRGSTALLDAIGRTIVAEGSRLAAMPESERPKKVLFVILTDGQENASREFDRPRIFDMITHQREKYAWEFVFVGANQDAIATATSMGMNASNASNYSATRGGTKDAFLRIASSAQVYSAGHAAQVDNFFVPVATTPPSTPGVK